MDDILVGSGYLNLNPDSILLGTQLEKIVPVFSPSMQDIGTAIVRLYFEADYRGHEKMGQVAELKIGVRQFRSAFLNSEDAFFVQFQLTSRPRTLMTSERSRLDHNQCAVWEYSGVLEVDMLCWRSHHRSEQLCLQVFRQQSNAFSSLSSLVSPASFTERSTNNQVSSSLSLRSSSSFFGPRPTTSFLSRTRTTRRDRRRPSQQDQPMSSLSETETSRSLCEEEQTSNCGDDNDEEQDFYKFAEYLGVDPVCDSDLLWIVDEAWSAPLPSGWSEHLNQDGLVFYYNEDSDSSQWEHPLDDAYRNYIAQLLLDEEGTDRSSLSSCSLFDDVRPLHHPDRFLAHPAMSHDPSPHPAASDKISKSLRKIIKRASALLHPCRLKKESSQSVKRLRPRKLQQENSLLKENDTALMDGDVFHDNDTVGRKDGPMPFSSSATRDLVTSHTTQERPDAESETRHHHAVRPLRKMSDQDSSSTRPSSASSKLKRYAELESVPIPEQSQPVSLVYGLNNPASTQRPITSDGLTASAASNDITNLKRRPSTSDGLKTINRTTSDSLKANNKTSDGLTAINRTSDVLKANNRPQAIMPYLRLNSIKSLVDDSERVRSSSSSLGLKLKRFSVNSIDSARVRLNDRPVQVWVGKVGVDAF